MVRFLVGAAAAAVLGALIGAGSLALAYTRAPAVALPFDRPLPEVLAGFYNLERSGDLTFAWTGPKATVRLPLAEWLNAWKIWHEREEGPDEHFAAFMKRNGASDDDAAQIM